MGKGRRGYGQTERVWCGFGRVTVNEDTSRTVARRQCKQPIRSR
jgi:hypothetical protein